MAIGNAFGNTPAIRQQFSNLNPQQQNLQGQIANTASSLLNQPQQQFSFEPTAQRATRDFNANVVPSIAQRFRNMAGNGTQHSGSQIPQIANANADLQERLAILRNQFGIQNQQNDRAYAQNLSQLALTPSQDSYYQPEREGFGNLLSQFGPQLAGQALSYANTPDLQQQQQQNNGGGYLSSAARGATLGGLGGAAGGPAGAGVGAFIGALQGLIQQYFSQNNNQQPQQPQNNLTQFGNPAQTMNSGFPIQGGR